MTLIKPTDSAAANVQLADQHAATLPGAAQSPLLVRLGNGPSTGKAGATPLAPARPLPLTGVSNPLRNRLVDALHAWLLDAPGVSADCVIEVPIGTLRRLEAKVEELGAKVDALRWENVELRSRLAAVAARSPASTT